MAGDRFERHKQPWTTDEIQKLHTLAKKGMPLKQMAKALTRSIKLNLRCRDCRLLGNGNSLLGPL